MFLGWELKNLTNLGWGRVTRWMHHWKKTKKKWKTTEKKRIVDCCALNAAATRWCPRGGRGREPLQSWRCRSAPWRYYSCPCRRSRPPVGHRSRHVDSNNWSMFGWGNRRCVSHDYLVALWQQQTHRERKECEVMLQLVWVLYLRLFTENSMICVILRQYLGIPLPRDEYSSWQSFSKLSGGMSSAQLASLWLLHTKHLMATPARHINKQEIES